MIRSSGMPDLFGWAWRLAVVVAMVAGTIAVLMLISGRLFPRMYFGYPLDPDAANIVPIVGLDAARITVSSPPDTHPPGVEGSVLFVRLTDIHGGRILDRPFSWSSDEQPVPPGDYHVTVYMRVCDANCGNLDPEGEICRIDAKLQPRGTLAIEMFPRDLSPGTTCTFQGAGT